MKKALKQTMEEATTNSRSSIREDLEQFKMRIRMTMQRKRTLNSLF